MQVFRQSDPRASERKAWFTAVSAASPGTYLQASDMGSFTVRIAKPGGGTAGAIAGSAPAEFDATNAKGLFSIALAAADIDTTLSSTLIITNAGGGTPMLRRDVLIRVDQAYFFTVGATNLTTSTCLTDRAETTADFWKDALVLMLTGSLKGQIKKVGAYSTGKVLTLASINGVQQTWTAAPVAGDIGELINR